MNNYALIVGPNVQNIEQTLKQTGVIKIMTNLDALEAIEFIKNTPGRYLIYVQEADSYEFGDQIARIQKQEQKRIHLYALINESTSPSDIARMRKHPQVMQYLKLPVSKETIRANVLGFMRK